MNIETAGKESKRLDFKERFDFNSHAECCELIKDIVAFANSGGGVILIGVKDNGEPAECDVSSVLSLDPAKLTDKIAAFTGTQFCDFEIGQACHDGHDVAALHIHGAPFPMVFEREGTYPHASGNKKIAFAKGTIYFRHGAKSEPANNADLRDVVERELEKRRQSWLGNVRKVVKAPAGARIEILPPGASERMPSTGAPVRIVDDPSAPAFRRVADDQLYPYRETEVLRLVNVRIGHAKTINTHDLRCVRRAHNIDAQPKYFHKPKFGSPQYSDSFVDWLVESAERNSRFFELARERCKDTSRFRDAYLTPSVLSSAHGDGEAIPAPTRAPSATDQ